MKTALIIDDSAFMRLTIKKVLNGCGYTVVGEANNGLLGVEKYKETQPDLVTLDSVMDEMGGLEALKHILDYDKQARVVMVSSMGQDAMMKEALTTGAKAFITKPFNEKRVKSLLSELEH